MQGFVQKLKKASFKLTPQRMAIAQYLDGNKSHPTAAHIYEDLKPRFPSISMATVYNTLGMMTSLGLLKELKIFKHEVNYDPDINDHHHFCCVDCKAIIDIPAPRIIPHFKKIKKYANHRVDHITMILRGVCKDCQ